MSYTSKAAALALFLSTLAFAMPAMAQPAAYDRVADTYPKNDGIDILHYAFEIQIADRSDEIHVVATIDARYRAGRQDALRLDLVQRSDSLEGKGMVVDRVTMDGQPLAFRHEDDRLLIDLCRPIDAQARVRVQVAYHGTPAAGLKIAPNKYGDFSIFSDNWSSKARHWLATVDHPTDIQKEFFGI